MPTNNDIYNAGAWRFDAVLQPETRAAWQMLVDQGWIDSARHLHPVERRSLYTFWVNESAYQRGAGFRMDFLLMTPGLLPLARATGVDHTHRAREKPSDHAPAWLELDLPAVEGTPRRDSA